MQELQDSSVYFAKVDMQEMMVLQEIFRKDTPCKISILCKILVCISLALLLHA